MTLKKIALSACIAALATLAIGEEVHHPDQPTTPPAAAPRPVPAPAPMDMRGMQDHMKRMQEQMAQFHASADPKERHRLMEEHMKSMDEAMPMMRGMMQRMQVMDGDKPNPGAK